MLKGLRTSKRRKTSEVDSSNKNNEAQQFTTISDQSNLGGSSVSDGKADILKIMREREMDMDEAYVRNISRLGKHYKRHVGAHFGSSADGADEDDQQIDMSLFQTDKMDNKSDTNTKIQKHSMQRAEHREANLERRAESITSRCWWWIQSKSFQKFLMIALGDHVALVLAPSHMSLVKGHCYLVPVKHAQSFCSCDNEVWEEVNRFRNSLRQMYAKEGKGVLFCETVLEAKGFWQARMDVIPVPKKVSDDAPMFFKSSIDAQIEEFGTHTKIYKTKENGLRGCIPKGFPYFNVEWNGGGFAHIIESRSFPKDFGVDTIASIMEMDPLRFNKKRKDNEVDRKDVLSFCEKWKQFDWTLQLS